MKTIKTSFFYLLLLLCAGLVSCSSSDDESDPGNPNGEMTAETNKRWLYVNPIIGRVVAGYAFHEVSGGSAAYAATSAKLNNGTKGYGIPDLKKDSTSVVFASAGASAEPNRQLSYQMSASE